MALVCSRVSVAAHEHLQPAVIPQAHHHANAGQVVADALAHADAVGALVAAGSGGEVVVELVQTTDEGFVAAARSGVSSP